MFTTCGGMVWAKNLSCLDGIETRVSRLPWKLTHGGSLF